jgi:hypothetical protein
MSIFAKIWSALVWFKRLFTSDAAQEAFALVDSILPVVSPVVDAIRKIVPDLDSATIADIKAAYAKFGFVVQEIGKDKIAFGWALSRLALMVARDRIPGGSSIPTRIIQAAIELALVAIKARG